MKKHILSGLMMALCLGGAMGLAACSSGQNATPLSELQFNNIQPLFVSAADIRVENYYSPGTDARDIATSLPTPPDVAIANYARNRLRAAQGVGTLVVTIQNAGVYKTQLTPEGKIGQWTGTGGRTKYDATVKVGLNKDVADMRGTTRSSHEFTVNRSVTIPDSYSLADRDAELQGMIATMVEEADKAITETLHRQNLLVNGY